MRNGRTTGTHIGMRRRPILSAFDAPSNHRSDEEHKQHHHNAGPSKSNVSRSREVGKLTQRTNYFPADHWYNGNINEFSDEERSTIKKKKYYIVGDEERPAELYRTDLLRRVKQEEESESSDEEDTFVRISDRWREEWSRGVQVPLFKKLPEFVFNDVPCTSAVVSHSSCKIFKDDSPLIAVHDRRYVQSGHKQVKMPPPLLHQIDELDQIYLTNLNEKRVKECSPQISEECFGAVLDRLEVDCYKYQYSPKAIHHDLLAPIVSPVISSDTEFDEDACCDICRQPDYEEDDKIIFCDGCNLSVHQSCYGLDCVPSDEWICQKCLALGFAAAPQCVLCPLIGGAMKCTKDGDLWAHVVCALWIREVRFTDVDHREPIANLNDIPNERWMLKCSVCDTRQGVCIQCTVETCTTAFHVCCAQRYGLVLRIEHENSTGNRDGVRMVSLCGKHSREAYEVDGAKSYIGCDRLVNSFTLDEMQKFFFLYVSQDEISKSLKIDAEIVNDIYEYWKMRRADNYNEAMLTDVSDLELETIRCVQSSPNVLQSMKSKSKAALRQNLERVRNLCYMIGRREKLKRSLYICWMETYECVYNTLLENNTVPYSHRALERFISALELPRTMKTTTLFSETSVSAMQIESSKKLPVKRSANQIHRDWSINDHSKRRRDVSKRASPFTHRSSRAAGVQKN